MTETPRTAAQEIHAIWESTFDRMKAMQMTESTADLLEYAWAEGFKHGRETAQDAARQRDESVDRLLDQVLLEAAHYNKFQGKVAHANLRMILDAARDRALLRATEGKQP